MNRRNTILFFILITAVNSLNASGFQAEPDSAAKLQLRIAFYEGVEDEDKVDWLIHYIHLNYTQDINNYPPYILAYYGAAETLKGKHAFNPYNKYDYLVDGLDKLEKAIKQRPDNLEIRFMRLSILHYIPGIFGYGEETESDLNAVYLLLQEKDYSELGRDLQRDMVNFLIETERLTPGQEKTMKALYN